MDERYSHLVPLIVFTTLVSWAAALVLAAAAGGTQAPVPAALVLGILAVAASLLHLGRKLRAPLALAGVARSWLSREVALTVGFVALTGAVAWMGRRGADAAWVRLTLVLAAVIGLAAVIAIGRLYHLHGQTGWQGTAQRLGPVTSTLAAGTAVWLAVAGVQAPTLALVAFLVLVALDAYLAHLRRRHLFELVRKENPRPTYPRPARAGLKTFTPRFLLSILAAASALLLSGAWLWGTVVLLGAMILLDRLVFYAGAARTTPRIALEEIRKQRLEEAAEYEVQTEA